MFSLNSQHVSATYGPSSSNILLPVVVHLLSNDYSAANVFFCGYRTACILCIGVIISIMFSSYIIYYNSVYLRFCVSYFSCTCFSSAAFLCTKPSVCVMSIFTEIAI